MKKLLLLFIIISFPPKLPSFASPVCNAGADQTIALPTTQVSIFGSCTDADTSDVLTETWTVVSGGTVTFSASWHEITTATFTTSGTYTLRLTASDGTNSGSDDVVITVQSAANTEYYVDPTYTGGSNDGTPTHPWTAIDVGNPINTCGAGSSVCWTSINNSLSTGTVTVFFSARIVASDTAETSANQVTIWRTDTSINRLTFDGMSKWKQTDTATNDWATYTGSNKYKLALSGQSMCIGLITSQSAYKMNYVTVRGFDCSATSGTATESYGGNQVIIEYMHVHNLPDGQSPNTLLHAAVIGARASEQSQGTVTVSNGGTTVTGSGTHFLSTQSVNAPIHLVSANQQRNVTGITNDTSLTVSPAWTTAGSSLDYDYCLIEFNNLVGITLRSNTIDHGSGEGLYVGGTYDSSHNNGCPYWGNTHSDILIESNTVDQSTNTDTTEQADGIDVKFGLTHMAVRFNTIIGSNRKGTDLVTDIGNDSATTSNSGHLYEANIFHGNVCSFDSGTGDRCAGLAIVGVSKAIIRNNLLYHSSLGIGIANNAFVDSSAGGKAQDGAIYNNTIYDIGDGTNDGGQGNMISVGLNNGTVRVRNNLLCKLNNTSNIELEDSNGSGAGLSSDYNITITSATLDGGWSEGAHSSTLSNCTGLWVNAGTDFHIVTGSAAKDVGLDLSNRSNLVAADLFTFAIDLDKILRPQGSSWDIGAYEFVVAAPPTTAVSRMRLRK